MISLLRKHLISEPMIFFSIFGAEMSYSATYYLYFQKACRNVSFSAPDLKTRCDDEGRGSNYITSVYNSFLLPGLILSLVFTVFASSYSDLTRKRRVFMVLPIIGQLLKQTVSMAQTIFWSWSPLSGIILGSIADFSLGGLITLFTFMNTYLFDRTTNENRLTRVMVQSVVQTAGNLMGKACGGFVPRRYGLLMTFVVCFVIYSLALISALIFVRDETVKEKPKIGLRDIFHLRQVRETCVLVALPKKPKKHIASIWLLLAIDMLINFTSYGEQSIFYLYFRQSFSWDEEKFGFFTCYRNGSSTIGSVICSLLMSNWLKIHDGIIGAFAAFWDTIAVIGFYFAREEWQLYLVPIFDIFHGLAVSTCFSQIGNFFTDREFGRLNSMKMIFFTIGMTSAIPMYSGLYSSTKDTHPNAFFLLSAFLSILICIFYSITFFLSKDVRSEQKKYPTEQMAEKGSARQLQLQQAKLLE